MNELTEADSKPRGRPAKVEAVEVVESVKPLKMFKVTIHSGEDEGDKGDVFLSHNNKSILIQRDKEVVISEYFVECLNHSMIETVTRENGGDERPVKIPRFAYNVAPA